MNDKRKKLFAASIMLLIGAGIAGCAKSSDDASQKQVLKLSASAPLDTIDISKATGYGQTGNIDTDKQAISLKVFTVWERTGKQLRDWRNPAKCQRTD